MKKIIVILMIVLIGSALFAAGAKEATPTKKGFTIVALHGSLGNTWRVQLDEQMKYMADKYTEQGILANFTSFTAEGDANLQAQQFSQVVNQGADAVLINPVSATALFPIIDRAVQRGIKVFAIDSLIDHPDVITVTNDQTYWATKHVEWFVEAIGGKGNIFWFDAIPGVPASDERTAVYTKVLANYPDIKVIARDHHNWSVAIAREKTAQLLAAHNQKIDGVLSQECSAGIILAFAEAGRPAPIAINGGNSMEDLRLWAEYGYSSLMVENPPAVGAHGLMIAVRVLQGKAFSPGVMNNNIIKMQSNLIITDETRDAWLAKTANWPDSQYIDTLMTDVEMDALFR